MQALSIEVKPFGIQCCTFFPGDTKTELTLVRRYAAKSQTKESVYSRRVEKSVRRMEHDEENGMEARYVARKMVGQLLRKQMRVAVIPGIGYKILCCIYGALPMRWRLWMVGRIY